MLAQLTHAVTFAAQHMACISLIARYFPDRLRGRGRPCTRRSATAFRAWSAGVAGGLLSERFGLAAVFWASSGSALLSALCVLRSRRYALATS